MKVKSYTDSVAILFNRQKNLQITNNYGYIRKEIHRGS